MQIPETSERFSFQALGLHPVPPNNNKFLEYRESNIISSFSQSPFVKNSSWLGRQNWFKFRLMKKFLKSNTGKQYQLSM